MTKELQDVPTQSIQRDSRKNFANFIQKSGSTFVFLQTRYNFEKKNYSSTSWCFHIQDV